MKVRSEFPFLSGSIAIAVENNKVISIQTCSYPVKDGQQADKFTEEVYGQLLAYTLGKRREFTFPYLLRGTDFQIRVWNALQNIPYGKICSYQDIAVMIGSPKAYRAVGMADHQNPMHIVIPCHRVTAKDGSLCGYAGGQQMKRELLLLEKKFSYTDLQE